MATPVLSSQPRFRLRPFRLIGYCLVLLLVFMVIASTWFYRTAKRSLPQLSGTIAIAGLHSEVSVVRDIHGVPHITATDLDSLLFVQGYVTAQDRLWQIDMLRRVAAGEVAEVLGRSRLELDRQQRVLQIGHAVEAALGLMTARDREYFESYARGVNAFIGSHRNNLPIEFQVLRYQPRRWEAKDSLLVGANMNQMLNTQYETELYRERILRKLPMELAADLYPNSSWRDHPPGSEGTVEDSAPSEEKPKEKVLGQELIIEPMFSPNVFRVDDLRDEKLSWKKFSYPEFAPDERCLDCMAGSNNWAVSGAHTASGQAMLSNDMHLAHHIPNIWYEAHLHCKNFNVVGVTIPGIPFVIVGHNQRIAWGFTNLGPDVQDLYLERLNDHGEYQTPQGWAPLEHRKEVIKVKGEADELLDVAITRHGPIINSIIAGERRSIALKWTLYDPSTMAIPFFDIDSAQNWREFRAAFSKFGGPAQNVVYADINGHIGYQASGKIPLRAAGDGLTPVSGADDSHEWTGYIPFEDLPSVFDPPSGIIATANSRIAPEHYKYPLANQWIAPYRTQRIYTVLEAKPKLTRKDMLALQNDVYSDVDRYFANQFVYAVDHLPTASTRARKAAEVMRGWDGRLTIESPAATIRAFCRSNLWKLLLKPRLGEDWTKYRWFSSTVALENLISRRPQRWLPRGYATWDELLSAAVEETVQEKDAPRDLTKWKYGSEFPVELRHPIFGQVPILRRWAGPGVQPQSGGSATVKQVGRSFGPSERMTVDLSDLDSSTLNLVAGQSGQLFSPYFLDHWPAWYSGTTFTLPFSQEAIAKNTEHSLRLVPAP